jgi:DNA-binding NtrC family response regulator
MARTILVVDDDPAIQEVIKIILEDTGYRVILASCWADIEAALAAALPDLVFLDVRLGNEDGRRHAQTLARLYPGLPVILITAANDPDSTAKGTGAKAVLAKPFDMDKLVALASQFLA